MNEISRKSGVQEKELNKTNDRAECAQKKMKGI
jgi:hypothetical protein